jgi:hypothetical protein
MRKRFFLASVATAYIGVIPMYAVAADTVQHIDGSVPMLCRDSTGTDQPLVRTDYSRLQEEFVRVFGWRSSLHSTSESLGYLVFSVNGQPNAPEKIVYDVEPKNGEILLLHMHVRLKGITKDLSGTEMCGETWSIVNNPN